MPQTVQEFWQRLDELCAASEITIDRPRGTAHPEFPRFVYPVDYGYLEMTRTTDGEELDVFLGSRPERNLGGLAVVIDVVKREVEIKLLVGCTVGETTQVVETLRANALPCMLVSRNSSTRQNDTRA